MSYDQIGQLCALATAITWAFALVLFKKSGETVGPLALNLFKNVIALALLAITLPLVGEGLDAIRDQSWHSIGILLISGVIGIAMADTAFFYSLNKIGVGFVSIVECAYSPSVILCSYLMLGDRLTLSHYVGAGFILTAVLISSRHKPPPGKTSRDITLGFIVGVAAMAMMAYGIVLAKPVLTDFPLIWATTLRLLGGTVAIAIIAVVSPRRREYWRVFKPTAMWRVSVPGSIMGTYFALILWVAGFKYSKAGVVAMLNQTSVIFALIFASLILKEPFGRRKAMSIVLAITGIVIVTTKLFA